MGFSSQDDLIYKVTTLGQFLSREIIKSTAPVHTASGWHLLTALNGYPNATTFPAAADLVYQNCDEANGDGTTIISPPIGGVVAPSTKHVLSAAGMIVAAAGAPWILKLVDLMGYYLISGANVTGTSARTLLNDDTFTANAGTDIITYARDWKSYTKVRFTTTGTLPAGLALLTDYWLVRQSATTAKVATSYANALAGTTIDITDAGSGTHTLTIRSPRYEGVGVEAAFVAKTAPATGGPNLSASAYTNSAGTGSRAFQGTPSMAAAADAYATRIPHSGAAANRYGAFLPRQGADVGIQKVDSFTFSGGTAYTGSGVLALALMRPLGVDLMLPATGVLSQQDMINQIPSMPKVEDGACLQWLLFGAGATTTGAPVTTRIDVGWG